MGSDRAGYPVPSSDLCECEHKVSSMEKRKTFPWNLPCVCFQAAGQLRISTCPFLLLVEDRGGDQRFTAVPDQQLNKELVR